MILSRPVKPRASRSALIAASVPELVNRTFSRVGTAEMMRSLSSISRSVAAPKLLQGKPPLFYLSRLTPLPHFRSFPLPPPLQPLPPSSTTHSTNNHRFTRQIHHKQVYQLPNPTLVKQRVQWRHLQTQAAIKEKNNYTTTMVCLQRNQYNLTIQLMAKRCTWLTLGPRRLGDDLHTNQFDEYDDSSRNEEKDEASNYDTT